MGEVRSELFSADEAKVAYVRRECVMDSGAAVTQRMISIRAPGKKEVLVDLDGYLVDGSLPHIAFDFWAKLENGNE